MHRLSSGRGVWIVLLSASPVLIAALGAPTATATTVINVPPSAPPASVPSDTQINVLSGGAIGDAFTVSAANGSITDVELNVLGGSVGRGLTAFQGAKVNLSSGLIDSVFRVEGGTANISGGTVYGRLLGIGGGTVNISGGQIELTTFGGLQIEDATVNVTGGVVGEGLSLNDSVGQLNISGGNFGPRIKTFYGAMHVYGAEFWLGQIPIPGLGSVGDVVQYDLPANGSLTAVLVDGTPFALNSLPVPLSDSISPGTLYLHRAAVPDSPNGTFWIPTDAAPPGLRNGQTAFVNAGGTLREHFVAAAGSTIHLDGGTIGNDLEAVRAYLYVSSGTTGNVTAQDYSAVYVGGGQVGDLYLATGSTAEISNGTVGPIDANGGGQVRILGGEVDRFAAYGAGRLTMITGSLGSAFASGADSSLTIGGGTISHGVRVEDHAKLEISEGTFESTPIALPGTEVSIKGGRFFLDGVELNLTPNTPFEITQEMGTLSGILVDGSPFSFLLEKPGSSRNPIGISAGALLTVTRLIPEPSSGLLAVGSLGALGAVRSRRRTLRR